MLTVANLKCSKEERTEAYYFTGEHSCIYYDCHITELIMGLLRQEPAQKALPPDVNQYKT